MQARAYTLLVGLALVAAGRTAPEAAPQTAAAKPTPQVRPATQSSAQEKLPSLSYICTMTGDEAILEDKPGRCPNPKCGMDLKPVRLATAYSCTVHTTVTQEGPGRCPFDKRELVPITASMFWLCTGSDEHLLEPGRCAEGTPRKVAYERRPHGDHNPRHGGWFFMADDSWHHLEGTYPRGGPFRVFFYDDFTRPMPAKGFSGDVVLLDANENELDSFTLKPGRITNTLETPVKGAALPLKVKLKVQFEPPGKERLFDFTFPEYTREPASVPAGTAAGARARPSAPASTATARPATSPSTTAVTPAPSDLGAAPDVAAPSTTMSRAEAAQLAQELPNNSADLLKLMELRRQEVETLIQDGNFGMVYVPTMLAKDVALALEDHANELPDRQRMSLTSAVKRLVVASWRLDQYGDLGDRVKITQAYTLFAAAAADIKTAYAARR